jgi:uncharacterized protein (DUF433 family)
MESTDILERIVINPKIMVGKPVIKGTRLTVDYILGLLAQGETPEDIIREYNDVQQEDIQACLLFAAKTLKNTEFIPVSTERI